jgi:hypothetical protein
VEHDALAELLANPPARQPEDHQSRQAT